MIEHFKLKGEVECSEEQLKKEIYEFFKEHPKKFLLLESNWAIIAYKDYAFKIKELFSCKLERSNGEKIFVNFTQRFNNSYSLLKIIYSLIFGLDTFLIFHLLLTQGLNLHSFKIFFIVILLTGIYIILLLTYSALFIDYFGSGYKLLTNFFVELDRKGYKVKILDYHVSSFSTIPTWLNSLAIVIPLSYFCFKFPIFLPFSIFIDGALLILIVSHYYYQRYKDEVAKQMLRIHFFSFIYWIFLPALMVMSLLIFISLLIVLITESNNFAILLSISSILIIAYVVFYILILKTWKNDLKYSKSESRFFKKYFPNKCFHWIELTKKRKLLVFILLIWNLSLEIFSFWLFIVAILYLIENYHPGFLLIIFAFLSLFFPLLFIIPNIFSLVKRVNPRIDYVILNELTEKELDIYAKLQDYVIKLTNELGIYKPELRVVEEQGEKTPTESFVFSVLKSKNFIKISRSALTKYDLKALKAFVAHEVWHFKNDQRLSKWMLLTALTWVPINSFLSLIDLSRREYLADEFAAQKVGPDNMIAALEALKYGKNKDMIATRDSLGFSENWDKDEAIVMSRGFAVEKRNLWPKFLKNIYIELHEIYRFLFTDHFVMYYHPSIEDRIEYIKTIHSC